MASNGMQTYVLGSRRLARCFMEGFHQEGDAVCALDTHLRRHLIFPQMDSAKEDYNWGRLTFGAELKGEVLLTVRAFASNDLIFVQKSQMTYVDDFLLDPQVAVVKKEQLFGLAGGVQSSGSCDTLLYDIKGRYLWLWIEVYGPGEATIQKIRIHSPGDNFFHTFPEVYKSDGEFFHRFLSIFSTMYHELQEKIDALHTYVDVDTAPPEALPLLASWLGLELPEDLLSPEEQRILLREAPALIATKGTRRAVEGVVRLFVEEEVYLVEQNLLDSTQAGMAGDIYGKTPYDFALLINRKSDEKLRARLQYLVDQFRPVRSRARLIFLGDCGGLDAFSYLDINGAMPQSTSGALDGEDYLTGTVYLE